ncbi:MAG: hypothetical protein ACM3L6_04690 [Deltaproteobacteria bacterium]
MILFAVLAAPSCVRAEMRGESAGLFWIDVPEGWVWTQEPGRVTIAEFNGSDRIVIRFAPVENVADAAAARQLVFDAREDRRREVVARHGKSVMRVERHMDGVFALQTGFLLFTPEGMRQATSIVFFSKGHLFDVYFEAPREVFRLEMEKIIETWRFTEPPAEKSEDDDGETQA